MAILQVKAVLKACLGLALVASVAVNSAMAQSVVSTQFNTSDGFATGALNPGTSISSGDFSAIFTDGQQQQSFDGQSYNVGPAGFLYINGGAGFQGAASTGDTGVINFGQGATEVSFFGANRANGGGVTVEALDTSGAVLGSTVITQTNIQAGVNPALTTFNAASLGGLIGSLRVDLPGPAANPPYALAIDTFSATRASSLDESVNGDFSSVAATPTPVSLSLGSNVIGGSINSFDGVDGAGSDTRDFITFTLGAGESLAAINLLDYDDPTTAAGNDGNRGFYALIDGAVATNPGGGFTNLGGNHLDPLAFGSDLLPGIAGGGISGGTGFTSVDGGAFTLVIQQTGNISNDYLVDLVVVPEPASISLVAIFAPIVLALRRRRR